MRKERGIKSFVATCLVILILLFVVINYTRAKAPPDFYDKVQLAEQESQKIVLGTLLGEETVHLQPPGTKKYNRDCSRGSYTTSSGSSNGLWCRKGYANYYGLSALTDEQLESMNKKMLDLGWSLSTDAEEYTGQKQIILHDTSRGGGFSYSNSDGLTASLIFARQDARWSNCGSYPVCEIANDKKADPYAAVVDITVEYEVRPF